MNVQMNVRIDDQIKRAGDEVFGAIGLTPSQVVRSVWEFAAAHHEAPEIVRSAIGQTDTASDGVAEQILEASRICERFRERFGIPAPDRLEEIDYRDLRENAMRERMEERGLA